MPPNSGDRFDGREQANEFGSGDLGLMPAMHQTDNLSIKDGPPTDKLSVPESGFDELPGDKQLLYNEGETPIERQMTVLFTSFVLLPLASVPLPR